MKFTEYAMWKTFEKVFSDLGEVEEYGFNSWLDLFNHIQNEELDVLETLDGEVTYLVEEYAGGYLPDLLEYEYEYLLDVVSGIKTFNVEF